MVALLQLEIPLDILAFINLFPGFSQNNKWGAESYYDYLERAARELNLSVLCMDHYPVMKPGHDLRDNYLFNLVVFYLVHVLQLAS